MSATEWKPGDVASWEFGNRDPLIALRVGPCRDDVHPGRQHWHLVNGGWTADDQYARPLVVLDPESAEDVERLAKALLKAELTGSGGRTSCAQVALRELANPTPPKPDEPTGLGAVVEDLDGDRWVRSRDRWLHQIHGYGWTWDQVPAVRVLSEGVPE